LVADLLARASSLLAS